MTHIRTYLWKEWGQNRLLAFGALGVVLCISFVSWLVDATDAGQGMVVLGGPILAVILGVYALAREQGAIQGFWQSRPLSVTAWILSKYAMGLLILGGVFGVVALIQVILFYRAGLPGHALDSFKVLALVYSWIVLAIYSVAFVFGQWIRGVMHALILSMGAVALILLVPVIIPWLNAWSLTTMMQVRPGVLQTPGYIVFVAGMVAFSAGMVYLSYVLVKKRIQIDVDQRAIAWSTVILLLVLGAGALFPIGNNLTPEQILNLPVKQNGGVVAMAAQGSHVLVLLNDGPDRNSSRNRRFGLVRVEVNADEVPGGENDASVAEPVWFLDSAGQDYYYNMLDLVWHNNSPSVAYVLARKSQMIEQEENAVSYRLMTIRLDSVVAPVVDEQDLTPHLSEGYASLSAGVDQGRLYVYSMQKQNTLLVFSLDTPESPVLTSNEIVSRLGFYGPGFPSRSNLTQYQISTLPESQRNFGITHDLTRRHSWPWSEIQQDRIVAFTSDWVLTLFEKGEIDRNRIVLKSISRHPRSAVQKLLGLGRGGVIYSLGHWAVRTDGLGSTVYRISDTNEIQRVGHYGAGQGFCDMAFLPDEHVILGNDKLHVLKLPEH